MNEITIEENDVFMTTSEVMRYYNLDYVSARELFKSLTKNKVVLSCFQLICPYCESILYVPRMIDKCENCKQDIGDHNLAFGYIVSMKKKYLEK